MPCGDPTPLLNGRMAFFGPLATFCTRCAHLPEFKAALTYAEQASTPGSAVYARIVGLAEGTTQRHDLAEGAYAMEMAYRTKPRSGGFFETHRRYIDVQLVVAGEEAMEVTAAIGLGISSAYDEAKDFTKHSDTDAASVIRVRSGEVAVFWPEDAHMPSLLVREPALVRKTVIKVPVSR